MFRDKLKKIFLTAKGENNEGEPLGDNKKKIENLVFFIVLLIITIVVINIIWNGNDKKSNTQENIDTGKKLATTNELDVTKSESNTELSSRAEELEEKLENILSKIQGVGEVSVCINYSESSEVVAMYNENSKVSSTEETDTEGGTRQIEETDTQKEIIYQEEDGVKTPITQKVIKPKVEGAIITAKGAKNTDIKTNIIQAVEAITRITDTQNSSF